jgi:hypothetical protein
MLKVELTTCGSFPDKPGEGLTQVTRLQNLPANKTSKVLFIIIKHYWVYAKKRTAKALITTDAYTIPLTQPCDTFINMVRRRTLSSAFFT